MAVQEANETRAKVSVVLEPSATIWNGMILRATSMTISTFAQSKVAREPSLNIECPPAQLCKDTSSLTTTKESGKESKDSTSFKRHLESHERGVALSESLKKHRRTRCTDPRCDYKQRAIFLVEHEKQHKTGKFACGACGLNYTHVVYANKHALNDCKVENAAQIHVPPTMKVTCPEERCGHEREKTELGRANLDKHIKAQHENGSGNCGICGIPVQLKSFGGGGRLDVLMKWTSGFGTANIVDTDSQRIMIRQTSLNTLWTAYR
ncbi:hypothetical protein KCU64_g3359, partial [Aureobasidium melanogenum]